MIRWKKMPAPQDELILIAYDDGEIRLIAAEDNDYEWIAYKGRRQKGIQKPKYWASITKAPR